MRVWADPHCRVLFELLGWSRPLEVDPIDRRSAQPSHRACASVVIAGPRSSLLRRPAPCSSRNRWSWRRLVGCLRAVLSGMQNARLWLDRLLVHLCPEEVVDTGAVEPGPLNDVQLRLLLGRCPTDICPGVVDGTGESRRHLTVRPSNCGCRSPHSDRVRRSNSLDPPAPPDPSLTSGPARRQCRPA